jgi:hypothetical protein
MSLTGTDLVMYGSANMPESGSLTVGGAIATTVKVIFDDATLANTLNDKVALRSSNTSDTSTVVVTGRDSVGAIVNESFTLAGTGFVVGTQDFERLLKIVTTNHTGNISGLRNVSSTGLFTIQTGITSLRRPFYGVAADAAGGSARTFYEKIFLKNTSATNALNDAQIIESADPSGKLTFALESGKGGVTSVANRETAPHSGTAFDSNAKTILNSVLSTGDWQGIWLKLDLNAGDSPAKTTYTLQASGTTT